MANNLRWIWRIWKTTNLYPRWVVLLRTSATTLQSSALRIMQEARIRKMDSKSKTLYTATFNIRSLRRRNNTFDIIGIFFSSWRVYPLWMLAIIVDHITLFTAVLNKAVDIISVQARKFRSQAIRLHSDVLRPFIFLGWVGVGGIFC